jgi:hypothetical protein
MGDYMKTRKEMNDKAKALLNELDKPQHTPTHQFANVRHAQEFFTDEQIVRAVNCHEELLDLIKRMNYAFYVYGTSKALKPIMAETKALIAKAEGSQAHNGGK